jgi:Putative redox-active protein (C_GCAxxG_C_C)
MIDSSMTSNDNKTGKRSLSRRDFAKKSILAIAAAGTAGLIGYGAFNTKKIRTINNVHRMGHCAPSIMQTLLEINGVQNTNMVLYTGAMAGGIAGANTECGALTAPLMFIGYQNNNLTRISEKLDIISKAQSYVNEFSAFNGSSICNKIRQGGMQACRKAMYNFYKPFSKALSNPARLSEEAKESYSLLLKTFDDNKFHCAHNVLNNLNSNFFITKEILDSSWVFIGGIALLTRTCGALTAGVMALSSVSAKIEDSYSRVARMNRLLRHENNKAMNEDINNFNRSINYSAELGVWFRNVFGSTTCYDIWGYNFSKTKGAESYISGRCMKQCEYIAKMVAQQVNMMI